MYAYAGARVPDKAGGDAHISAQANSSDISTGADLLLFHQSPLKSPDEFCPLAQQHPRPANTVLHSPPTQVGEGHNANTTTGTRLFC